MITHEWTQARIDDARSCCPGLNALANHSYIHHDGKDITFYQLFCALHEIYGLSYVLSVILSFIALISCGRVLRGTIDLDALCKSNLQHGAALVHSDPTSNKPIVSPTPDSTLLLKLMHEASNHVSLSIIDLARARADREKCTRLDHFHHMAALSETAVLWQVFRDDDGKVPVKCLPQFLGEERLPDGWSKRGANTTGFINCQLTQRKLQTAWPTPEREKKV